MVEDDDDKIENNGVEWKLLKELYPYCLPGNLNSIAGDRITLSINISTPVSTTSISSLSISLEMTGSCTFLSQSTYIFIIIILLYYWFSLVRKVYFFRSLPKIVILDVSLSQSTYIFIIIILLYRHLTREQPTPEIDPIMWLKELDLHLTCYNSNPSLPDRYST